MHVTQHKRQRLSLLVHISHEGSLPLMLDIIVNSFSRTATIYVVHKTQGFVTIEKG